jgi:drug/metabolite transporter (DMT)-like permease
MAYLLALLAAFAFALGNVLQQKGALETPAGEDDPRFLTQILRRPIWLAGAGSQLSGWVLQAVALDKGSLIVVQSLTTMSLVIALPLGRRFTDQKVSRRVWLGALAMVVGIVLFLSVGSPQGGTSSPSASAWWSAGLGALVVVAVLANLGRHRRGAAKALLFGSAAGVGFALQASVTKVFVTLVGKGPATLLTSWTIWVLMASAVIGFVLQQSALKTGVLAPAMASSNAVTLFASVVFGATIFGESLSSGGGRLAPAIVGLSVALVGIVLLAGADPPQRAEPIPTFDQPPGAPSKDIERSDEST